MTIPILANSAGWKVIGPSEIDRYAPFTRPPNPGTRGSSSSPIEAMAIVYR